MKKISIALDVMGADHGISEIIAGAIDLKKERQSTRIVLVGDEAGIKRVLDDQISGSNGIDLEIEHAPELITMEDAAVRSIRQKNRSSIVKGLTLMRDGAVDAFVSPGNTGAVMAAALLILGRAPGILRPAIAAIIPAQKGPVILTDAGANADAKPEFLLQYAYMAEVYASKVLGINNSKVGLLNIGEEKGKGNHLTLKTYDLLKASHLNFVGNVEGRDVSTGDIPVIVTDGFTGNVVLKTLEGLSRVIFEELKKTAQGSYKNQLGGILLKGSLSRLRNQMSYEEYGGAPLLGVNGNTIICHGSSKARAITNALKFAEKMAANDINSIIAAEVKS